MSFFKTCSLLKATLFLEGPFVRGVSLQLASAFYHLSYGPTDSHCHPERAVSGRANSNPRRRAVAAAVLSSDSYLFTEGSRRQSIFGELRGKLKSEGGEFHSGLVLELSVAN